MSVVYPSEVLPVDYTMYAKGSLIRAIPSPELELNECSGINATTVLQTVVDALYNKVGAGLIEVKSKNIQLPSPVTWRDDISIRGLGYKRTGFQASASMAKMFDLTGIAEESRIDFANLGLDGNNVAKKIIDASHPSNTWIQLRIFKSWLHGAGPSGSPPNQSILVDPKNVDGFRVDDSLLVGTDVAGTQLLTDHAIYIDECGGATYVDDSIISSFKTNHIYYKDGQKLTLTNTNLSSKFAPSGAYLKLISPNTESVVSLKDVWIESPLNAPTGMGDALISGADVDGDAILMLDILHPRFRIFSNGGATYGVFTKRFRAINIKGGYMKSDAAYTKMGDPKVLNKFTMKVTHINKDWDYTNMTRYDVSTPTLNYLQLTNMVSAIPYTVMFVPSWTWDNMPAAETELYSTIEDLSGVWQIRMVGKVRTAGATNAKLKIQYSSDEIAWYESGLDIPIGTIGTKIDGWIPIPTDMKADVHLRLVGIDGDGVADPWFQMVCMQMR